MFDRKLKYESFRWLGYLFAVLSLVPSSGVQAATTCATWWIPTVGLFPTQSKGGQAVVDMANQQLINSRPYLYPLCVYNLISCDDIKSCVEYSQCWGTDSFSVICWAHTSALNISLTGGSEVEPSNGATKNPLPFIATVIDQNTGQPPTSPVQVHISLKVDPASGGHDHGDSTRPRGGIAELVTCPSDDVCWTSPPTDGNGQVVFNFNPPEASGTHTITATCDGCGNTATANVDVKVEGLWPISGSVYYALTEDGSSKVIGSTTEHSSNHYVTSEAKQQLWLLAQSFYEYQLQNGVASPTLLHLNDASLKWGGLFDKDGDWDTPHKEHRRGSVIDMRANSSPGAIPRGLTKNFEKIAKDLGIDPHLEYDSDPDSRHFHTRLLNRKE